MEEKFTPREFLAQVYNKNGINEKYLKKCNNIDCIDPYGGPAMTPLDFAVWHNYLDLVQYLVEHDAIVTLHDNRAIRAAIRNNYITIVKYLLGTHIYSEEDIHSLVYIASTIEMKELLSNYTTFSYTKVIRSKK